MTGLFLSKTGFVVSIINILYPNGISQVRALVRNITSHNMLFFVIMCLESDPENRRGLARCRDVDHQRSIKTHVYLRDFRSFIVDCWARTVAGHRIIMASSVYLFLFFANTALAAWGNGNENKNIVGTIGIGESCLFSRCQEEGFRCNGLYCVPDMSKMEKIGQCVNNQCPQGYFCYKDSCLRLIPKKRPFSIPIGPCVNLQCPAKHTCDKLDNMCYPSA